MKRISWSNSPNCSQDKDVSSILISSSPSSAEEKIEYDERFQPLLVNGTEEVEEEDEELGGGYGQSSLGEKKRRLSADQVKALEKNFEVENKLDPERKVRLAQDLGLQPRQVAVWFQNRRARWKTKLLERDYGSLKDQYNALKLDCDALRHDKELLTAEIRELKAKLGTSGLASTTSELEKKLAVEEERPAMIYRDGSSDSDSSAVFNDETSPYSGVLLGQQQHCLMGFKSHCSFFLFQNTEVHNEKGYLEEGLLGGQELCSNLFSEEQAPSLSWYSSQGWE